MMCVLPARRTFTMATAPSKPFTTTPTSFTCLFIAMTTETFSLGAEHLMRWVCFFDLITCYIYNITHYMDR